MQKGQHSKSNTKYLKIDSPESVKEDDFENRSNNPLDSSRSSKKQRNLSAVFGGRPIERKATVMFNINETNISKKNNSEIFDEREIPRERGDTMIFKEDENPASILKLEDIDTNSLLSTRSKKDFMEVLKLRQKQIPYLNAIEKLSELQDFDLVRTPFEMITCISNISKYIEETITKFWEGITIIDTDKLIIDGDNILMLYLYIVLRARIPNMFAFIKMMDEFSTNYVRSISRYGYCLSTLEIAMERITNNTLDDLLRQQRASSQSERAENYKQNMRESFMMARERAGSLYVDNLDDSSSQGKQRPRQGSIKGVKNRSVTIARNVSVF